GGASRNRTDDLYNAIVALSQLSYDPRGAAPAPIVTQLPPFAGAGKYRPGRVEASGNRPPGSALLLVLDVLDHLGHVVLVLAELGGVLDQLLLLLLALAFGGGLALFGGLGLLALDLDFGLFGHDRRDLLLGHRG